MMPNTRVIPPTTTGIATITVNGCTYTTSNGAGIDVPDFDAQIMGANGWKIAAPDGSGTTAERPKNATNGMRFLDTTLGVVVAFDGKFWRNKITGAIA